ncbi:MAG: hypothetical protein JW726_16815 [Anaerolineales bacterium]|nr:hypothetical protein [Anaerolineales bacterium]
MNRKSKLSLVSMVVLCSILACSTPTAAPPTPPFTTPDLTLTAIFSVLYITPTTSPPTLPPPPTDTPVPPAFTETATLIPSVTEDILGPTLTSIVQTQTAIASIPPSSTPTKTPIPASATPMARPGSTITAAYLDDAPEIDGKLGDWNLNSYSVLAVTYGNNLWDNEEDLSATAMFGWDEDHFYIASRVTDEDYVQNAGGKDLYLGDSLELLLDTDLLADFYVNSLSPDDFQLGISPGSPEPGDDPESYLWFPRAIEGDRDEVEVAALRVDDGWNVEAAIPWDVFEMEPVAGRHYGFVFSISDNDRTGKKEQQTMISTIATRKLTDPTTWGDLILGKP